MDTFSMVKMIFGIVQTLHFHSGFVLEVLTYSLVQSGWLMLESFMVAAHKHRITPAFNPCKQEPLDAVILGQSPR